MPSIPLFCSRILSVAVVPDPAAAVENSMCALAFPSSIPVMMAGEPPLRPVHGDKMRPTWFPAPPAPPIRTKGPLPKISSGKAGLVVPIPVDPATVKEDDSVASPVTARVPESVIDEHDRACKLLDPDTVNAPPKLESDAAATAPHVTVHPEKSVFSWIVRPLPELAMMGVSREEM